MPDFLHLLTFVTNGPAPHLVQKIHINLNDNLTFEHLTFKILNAVFEFEHLTFLIGHLNFNILNVI